MNGDKGNRAISGANSDQAVMSSTTLSSTSSTSSTSFTNIQQQQPQQLLQPTQSETTEKKNSGQLSKSSSPSADESRTVVRMRNKPPLSQIQATTNGTAAEANENNKSSSLAVLQRGLEVLNEIIPEDDGKIRKLDSQLDHLNHYMDKVEERIKVHNEKLMDTLRHQREEREKRRRSFHEDFEIRIIHIATGLHIGKRVAVIFIKINLKHCFFY
uniref:Uncharacterized protein n=1 Tax=Setaria digitata TaxID=48799 RepID=A0A915PS50_9BILA